MHPQTTNWGANKNMISNKKNYCGLSNPLNVGGARFDYEVVELSKVTSSEFDDRGTTCTQYERSLVLRTLNGGGWYCCGDQFFCTAYFNDALKALRVGELISAKLSFKVTKDDNGNYVQEVTASEIFTLNDYYQIREDEAHYRGSQTAKKSETD